jgi:hypothetical protein
MDISVGSGINTSNYNPNIASTSATINYRSRINMDADFMKIGSESGVTITSD